MKLTLPQITKKDPLRQLAYQSLLELSTDEGINASGKEEIYGCIFGRDSFITILKILESHSKQSDKKLLQICKRSLLHLISLQGLEFNIESGEQPGKFIHEYRKDRHNHLTSSKQKNISSPWENSWYIYPDNTLRSYDSIDSTPLGLIAIYRYWETTADTNFLKTVLPAVEKALNWIITYGDTDKDHLLEYEFTPGRTYGGLLVQSWTDSHESIKNESGKMPLYPIAPVEVQGYAWLSLKLWGQFFKTFSPNFGKKLLSQADQLKITFNQTFIIEDHGLHFCAQALDGTKNQIKTITSNPLLLLWASLKKGYKVESILEDRYINPLIERAFLPDLFDPDAGLRTMSTTSKTYNPTKDSYHNGSFWPVLNGLSYEGLIKLGYTHHAQLLKNASLKPINYFNSPIELYIKNDQGEFLEYQNSSGQVGCRTQAWSAASLLDMTTTEVLLLKYLTLPTNLLYQYLILKPLNYLTLKKSFSDHHLD